MNIRGHFLPVRLPQSEMRATRERSGRNDLPDGEARPTAFRPGGDGSRPVGRNPTCAWLVSEGRLDKGELAHPGGVTSVTEAASPPCISLLQVICRRGNWERLTVEAQSRIRAHGRRMTHQRRLILELLENRGGHPSAEELFVQARQSDPDINLSTVYRTVRWLEAEGLIEPRRFEGTARKERFDPRSPGDHHHFVCESLRTGHRILRVDPSRGQSPLLRPSTGGA